MGNCLRCGREAMGQYCETCSFYANNDQCWRCRMYLPRVELQQWRGQIFCPYCIMDIRDEERRTEEAHGEAQRAHGSASPDGSSADPGAHGTAQKADYQCDKCKDDLDIVYVVADHKFCELCFQQQVRELKRGGIDPPPHMKFRAKDSGLLVKLLHILKHKIRSEWEKRQKKKQKKDEEK